jgi:hypothetical protein
VIEDVRLGRAGRQLSSRQKRCEEVGEYFVGLIDRADHGISPCTSIPTAPV